MKIKEAHKLIQTFIQQSEVAAKGQLGQGLSGEALQFANKVNQVFQKLCLSKQQTQEVFQLLDRKIKQGHESEINPESLRRIFKTSVNEVQQQKPEISETRPPEEEQEKVETALLMQNVIRGALNRPHVPDSEQINDFIKKNISILTIYGDSLMPVECEDASKIIADASKEMVKNPDLYKKGGGKGEGIRHAKREPWKIGKTEEYTLPNTIWMKLSDDSSEIRVQFIGNKKQIVGIGNYKKVKKSQTIVIPLIGVEPMRKEETVLVRSIDAITKDDKAYAKTIFRKEKAKSKKELIERWIDEDINEMKNTINTILNIFGTDLFTDPELKVAGVPKVIRTHPGRAKGNKPPRKKVEWEEPRFAHDLLESCSTGKVNTDLSGGNQVNFTLADSLHVIENILYAAEKMHAKGIVHRDIHPANVLLKYNPEKKHAEGYITDFDLIAAIGKNSLKLFYKYWDLCSEQGLAMPTTDVFGAGMCLGDPLFNPSLQGDAFSKRMSKLRGEMKKAVDKKHKNHPSKISDTLQKQQQRVDKKVDSFFCGYILDKIIKSQISILLKYPQSNPRKILSKLEKKQGSQPDLKELMVELRAAEKVANLLKDLYKQDIALYSFLFLEDKGKHIKDTLFVEPTKTDDTPEGIKKKKEELLNKQKKLNKIYDKFPIFKKFHSEIKKIHNELSNT